jgi:hypothetical protein
VIRCLPAHERTRVAGLGRLLAEHGQNRSHNAELSHDRRE